MAWDLFQKRCSPSVNILDPIFLVLVSLFGLRGYFKGLFRESFSLLGLILGFMVAARYDEPLGQALGEYWQFPSVVLKAITFVGLFLAVYSLSNAAGWLLHRSAKVLFLQTVNRVGGVVLGAGKGAAFLALGVLLLVSIPWVSPGTKQTMEGSYLAPPLYQLARELVRAGKTALLSGEDKPVQEIKAAGLFDGG